MKKSGILIALFLFMTIPLPDSKANTYAESPYDCDFNASIGVGASVSFMGFTFKANAEGKVSISWGNAGYSCSAEGVGCSSGFSCVDFWSAHAEIIPE